MWFPCFDRVWWSLSLSLSLLSFSLPYCYLTKNNLKDNVPNSNEWTSGVKQGVGKTICLYVVTDAVAPPLGNVSINTDRCSAVSPRLTQLTNQIGYLSWDTHTLTDTHTVSGNTLWFNLVKCSVRLLSFLPDMNLSMTESPLSHVGEVMAKNLPKVLFMPWPANFVMRPPANICIPHCGEDWK